MKYLKLLSKIALSFKNTENFDSDMKEILDNIGKTIDVSRIYIFSKVNDGIVKNTFEWCNDGICPQISNLQNLEYRDRSSWIDLFTEKGYISTDDIVDLTDDVLNSIETDKIKAVLIYPLIINNEIDGFIGFDEYRYSREWTEGELEIIRTIAGITAKAYEKILFEQNSLIYEENFKNFFETVGDMIIISDLKGNIIHGNKSLVDKLGYSLAELRNKKILNLHPYQGREEAYNILEKMFKEKIDSSQLKIEDKDGRIYLVETRIWFGEWDGKESIYAIIKDITQEKENLNLFSKIFETSPLSMAINNKEDKKTVRINEAFLEITGYSKKEIIGKTLEELNVITDYGKIESIFGKLRKNGTAKNKDLIVRCKDGTLLNGIFSIEKIMHEGRESYLTVMVDITERVKLTRSLEEQIQKFNNIIEGAKLGTWEWAVQKNEFIINKQAASVLGYTLEELEPRNIDTWERLVHPEDLKTSHKIFKKHIDGDLDYYESETRMQHKDGSWIWIQNLGRITETDENGTPVKMFGTNFNITEKKEQALELERFFSVNLDLLCIVNLDGSFIKVNKAWEDILGYPREELEGSNFIDYIHEDDIEKSKNIIKKLSLSGKVTEFVNRYRNIDGSYHYIEWRANLYGNTMYAAARDITNRVDYENKLVEISNRDVLTNVYNRRYVYERAKEMIEDYRRIGKVCSLAILDIDRFKKINDTYGHQVGDSVLKEFTKLIDKNLRTKDILGRYGGEEFIVVLNDTDKKTATIIMNRILEATRNKEFIFDGNDINFTFSAGIVACSEVEEDNLIVDSLIKIADSRMYKAKNQGRDRLVAKD